MATIVNQYSGQSPIGASIAEAAKSIFGDRLTPAVNRAKLEEQTSKNQNTANLVDTIRRIGAEQATRDYGAQASIVGSGYDPGKYAELNRLATDTNPDNPLFGERIARAGLGAGGTMAATPMGFQTTTDTARRGQDVSAATSRANNSSTIAEQRYQFENKPIGATVDGTPAFVAQKGATAPGVQPIIKNGITVFGPDGKPVVQMGGPGGGKLTESQSRNALFATRAAQANDVLSKMPLDDGLNLQNGVDYVAGMGRPSSPVMQLAANSAMSPVGKQRYQAANSFLTAIVRPDSGAALQDSEWNTYGKVFVDIPGDDPATRAQKAADRATAITALNALSNGGAQQIAALMQARGLPVPDEISRYMQGPLTSPPAGTPAAPGQAVPQMPAGAKQAADGQYYVPDPARSGKYLKVVQ